MKAIYICLLCYIIVHRPTGISGETKAAACTHHLDVLVLLLPIAVLSFYVDFTPRSSSTSVAATLFFCDCTNLDGNIKTFRFSYVYPQWALNFRPDEYLVVRYKHQVAAIRYLWSSG